MHICLFFRYQMHSYFSLELFVSYDYPLSCLRLSRNVLGIWRFFLAKGKEQGQGAFGGRFGFKEEKDVYDDNGSQKKLKKQTK